MSGYQQYMGTAEFRIGGHQLTSTESWNGLIDEVVVFTRPLSVPEIDAIRSGTYKGPISPTAPDPSFTPPSLTFAQAVNNPSLTFSHGGDTVWGIDNNETHDTGFSVKSGTISTNQESWFTTEVQGPGTLSFWWAVDSTVDHHYLEFLIDGSSQHSITGPNNPGAWAKKIYSITAGTHILKWRYYTDGTATSNRNAGWVDEIKFGRANDFQSDSTVKAYYKFQSSVDLGFDAISTNHLHNGNNATTNFFQFKDGFQSLATSRTNSQYLWCDDSELASDFPLKNGDATKTGTWCCWVNFTALNANTYYDIISKGSTTNRCLNLYYYNALSINWGYSGGNQAIVLSGALSLNRWYHISVSFDGVNKRLYARVWDDELQQIICDQVFQPTNALVTSADRFMMGAYQGQSYILAGLLNEVVIFNRQLPTWQMDAVRKGTYSGSGPTQPGNDFSSDSTCKALWKFESGALTTDSKSTNTLTDHSTVSITSTTDTVKEGSGCVKTTNAVATWLHIADTNLAAGFPLKNGDSNKIFSACLWFRPLDFASFRDIFAKRAWAANKGSFLVYGATGNTLYISYVYSTGTIVTQDFQIGAGLSTNVWYHLGFTIDGVNKKVTWRLYNSYTEAATYGEFYPGAELRVDDADLLIGAEQGATTGTSSNPFYGYIDEVVVFNRLLNILEIDAIRQGKYSGTGIEGLAVDYIGAQVALRTTDRQTYFCVDVDRGLDTANDGLSYTRPFHTHKNKSLSAGDVVTFAESGFYAQPGTVTVTAGSLSVTTAVDLGGTILCNDVVSFGSDDVLYSVSAITSTTITLYRPYRGTSSSGVTIYKLRGVILTDLYGWNTGSYKGFADKNIVLQGGINRSTGLTTGWTLFDQLGNYGVSDTQPYIAYKKFGFMNMSTYYFNVLSAGGIYEDIYLGNDSRLQASTGGAYQITCTRVVSEANSYFELQYIYGGVFNDCEIFGTYTVRGIYLNTVQYLTFNNLKTGQFPKLLEIINDAHDIVFRNSKFGDGVAHTYFLTSTSSSQTFFGNLAFVNCYIDPATTFMYTQYATQRIAGELSFEHYQQTQNDHRTFIYVGSPSGTYAGIQYRDAATYRTSVPSVRIDLTTGGQLPIVKRFYVPCLSSETSTISVYVRMNAAYLNNFHTLPKMVVRTISGTSPNFIWVDTESVASATADTWLQLSKTVTPSIDSVVEVFLYFQSVDTAAQCWFDDFDVTVS